MISKNLDCGFSGNFVGTFVGCFVVFLIWLLFLFFVVCVFLYGVLFWLSFFGCSWFLAVVLDLWLCIFCFCCCWCCCWLIVVVLVLAFVVPIGLVVAVAVAHLTLVFRSGCFVSVFACLCFVWLKMPKNAISLQFQSFFKHFLLPKASFFKNLIFDMCFSLSLFFLFLLFTLIFFSCLFFLSSLSLPFSSFILSLTLVLCQSLLKQFFFLVLVNVISSLALSFWCFLFASGLTSCCCSFEKPSLCFGLFLTSVFVFH